MHNLFPQGAAMGPVAPQLYIDAMGAAATGVNIVTTLGSAGRFGLTVSALSSVSAEPPLLLVCVNRRSPTVTAITQNGRFAVNILAENQADIARTFAGRPAAGAPYDFLEGQWLQGAAGQPLLVDAAAHFECEIDSIHDAGTHRIFIGRVMSAARGKNAPLVYSSRAFGRAAPFDGDS